MYLALIFGAVLIVVAYQVFHVTTKYMRGDIPATALYCTLTIANIASMALFLVNPWLVVASTVVYVGYRVAEALMNRIGN